MNYFLIIFVCICSCLLGDALEYKKAYQELATVLPYRSTIGIYYSNAKEIEEIFQTHQITKALEVGSFLGTGSTAHIGQLLQSRKGSNLFAVDHWLGSYNHQEGLNAYDPILPLLYDQFLSNMIHLKLTNVVIPIRMESVAAAQYLNELFDFIYIDAEHLEEFVYNDLVAWYPHLKENGVFCGDDWGTSEDVRIAVTRFANENNLELIHTSNFWRLLKKD